MIIVIFSGGLGNQMFQYALYLKYKSLGYKVSADLSFYSREGAGRNFELNVFGVEQKNIERSGNDKNGLIGLFRKWRGDFSVYKDRIGVYQPEVFERKNRTVSGYWQNEEYFSDIREIILKEFTFKNISEENNKLALNMSQQNSVSVHIRRGDYLEASNSGVYGQICTLNYYEKAISYIKEHVDSPVFYLFSDDPEWTRENIWEDGMILISHNKGENSYQDMFLMSKCKNHIIANSSFSWWGAWLDNGSDRIVVAPDKWLNNHETVDTVCKDWIRIEG